MPEPSVLLVDKRDQGGTLCLDFSNSLLESSKREPKRSIKSYKDFVLWCDRAGIIPNRATAAMLTAAMRDVPGASNAYAAALDLGNLIYRIFKASAENRDPDLYALSRFNDYHARAMSDTMIEYTEAGFRITFAADSGSLDWPLNAIARSAAGLLMGRHLGRVRLCSNPDCGRLFLDESKNRSRRWCDMRDCGNRAKARRHYRLNKVKNSVRDEIPARQSRPEAVARRALAPKTAEMEIGSND